MAHMTHRATFALDDSTVARIKDLASLWRVSQAEVVRRAVALAEMPASKPDPVEMLEQLHRTGGGLSAEVADAYLAEVREDRKNWRSR